MNVLFVDDRPVLKVYHIICQLNYTNTNFSFEIVKSVNSACRYIVEHSNQIDLIVLDLGLPLSDNGANYDSLNGLLVVKEMMRKHINIPIIINSCTEIPNEKNYLKQCKDNNIVIMHAEFLNGKILTEFMEKL